MKIEQVNTEWYDSDAIRLPNYKVGRVTFGKGRSYFRINEDGTLAMPFRLHTSLTTTIAQSLPDSRFLLDWKLSLGKAESERYSRMKADYGTLMHEQIGVFIKSGGSWDLESAGEVVQRYVEEHGLVYPEIITWERDLQKDLMAFGVFYDERRVKPLGLEYVLLSQTGYGTPIDLVCELDTDNGRKRAVINFKSGRKGFYESHEIQMEFERQLWNENFPDMPCEIACNWAPNDWRTKPSYKLKEWDGAVAEQIPHIIALAEVRYARVAERRKYKVFSGNANGGGTITEMNVQEYVMSKYDILPSEEVTQEIQKEVKPPVTDDLPW